MSVIEEVRREREDLARVLKKHTGIRKIVEDLYPDRAHFIYELLQNAEDTGATEAEFTLSKSSLTFEHNGRPFDGRDLLGITDIGEGTKAEDRIGRFGVGFKAVFAYCETPHVWSPTFSFKISDLVLPTELNGIPDLGCRTRFEFPFNNPKKTPTDAYREIEAGLNELADITLLFLSHLNSIRWQIRGTTSGCVAKRLRSENHVEISKEVAGTKTASHFLRFEQTGEVLDGRRVAVAFGLTILADVQQFLPGTPLHAQLKIAPATAGRVAVYFPAEKETSGLRFHLHAPFIPELSRASIKETPANHPLFQQLATLTGASLHKIRDLGLLTVDFLGVLPNLQDAISPRYHCICSAVIEEMKSQRLTPTTVKTHAPARYLLRAKAALKELLSEEDIQFLADDDDAPRQWAVSAPQKNSNADRFLDALGITAWGTEKFVAILSEKAFPKSRLGWSRRQFSNSPDPEFIRWIGSKSGEWHQLLYAHLFSEFLFSPERRRGQLLSQLKQLPIVRLSDGGYNVGGHCFFPSEGVEHDDKLPRVDPDVFTSGKSANQQENARKFLQQIGVREVGEAEHVEAILRQRYTRNANFQPSRRDLERFIAFVEKHPGQASLFSEYYVFERNDGNYGTPTLVFLDQPFLETGLSSYYSAIARGHERAALDESYLSCGISKVRLLEFAKAVGVQTLLTITPTTCFANPQWSYLSEVPGGQFRRPINRDFEIVELETALLTPSLALSRLVWRTMCEQPADCLQATYQKNEYGGCRRADSQLVHVLRNGAWIPQGRGVFVRPSEASEELLPDGFEFKSDAQWIKAIGFGSDAAKKSVEKNQEPTVEQKLGFEDPETLERARRFAALPHEEQHRILADWERKHVPDLPEQALPDPARRAERVAAEAADAPERLTEDRTRSVSVGREEVKAETEPYLRQEYTGEDGMICQVCKTRLPFKLDDGNDYFEKVEFLTELTRRHYQNYLALCPNHAAMFRFANGLTMSLLEDCVKLTGNELPVVLGQKNWTIYFTKKHIGDLRAVIAADRILPTRPLDQSADTRVR